jgi:hypothetical protein
VDDAIVGEWRQAVQKAYPRVRESLVPPAIFDEVVRLRNEYRKTGTGAPR